MTSRLSSPISSRVVATLGDRVEFVQQQNAVVRLRVVQYDPQIVARSAEKAAHHGRKIKCCQRSA